MNNSITSYTINEKVLMAFRADGTTVVFTKDHPDFNRVRLCLLKGDTEGALKASKTFAEALRANPNFSLEDDGSILFRGRAIPPKLAEKVAAIFREGGDFSPYENFETRRSANPSATSGSELYDFMLSGHFTITPRGTVVGYKGIRHDGYSVMGNTKTRVLQGKVNADGHILNEIGATIEVVRQDVDDNRARECSFGLHVGSFQYATSWGERTVMVEFDPADAVSVPQDCGCQKLRVCKYKVLEEVAREAPQYKREVAEPEDMESGGIVPTTGDVEAFAKSLIGECSLAHLYDISELYAYVLSNASLKFGDHQNVEDGVKDAIKAEQVRRESETDKEFDTATLEPFDARVKRYLDRKAPCTVRKLANSFSPYNPDLDAVIESARAAGYKVTPTDHGKSNWPIHRS